MEASHLSTTILESPERAAQKPVFSNESDDAASLDVELSVPKDVASVIWTSFHIIVSSRGQTVEKDLTICLQPLKMQYLLENKLSEIQKLIDPKKIKIEKIYNEKAVINLLGSNMVLEESLVEIVEIFENLSKDVSTKMYPIADIKIRMSTYSEVTKQLTSFPDAFAYNDGKSTVYLVCQTKSLQSIHKIVKSIVEKNQKTERRICIQSNIIANILTNLDFVSFFNSQTNENVAIDLKKQILIFGNANEADVVQYKSILDQFMNKTISTRWFCSVTVALLLKKANVKFKIHEKIRKRNIKCFIHLEKQQVVFYTLSGEEGKEALAVAKTSIQTIFIEEKLLHTQAISNLIIGTDKECITVIKDKDIPEITTTNDLATKILMAVEQITEHDDAAAIKYLANGKKTPSIDIMQYQLDEGLTIHLYNGNSVYFDQADVVVIPIYSNDKLTEGNILDTIFDMSDEPNSRQLQPNLKSMKSGEVKICPLNEKMNWTHVIFEKVSSNSKEDGRLEYNLKQATENVFNEAMKMEFKSLIMPFYGTALSGMQTPVHTCCQIMVDGICSMINKRTKAKKWNLDLWIVATDLTAMHSFKELLDTSIGSKSSNSKLRNQKTDDKTLDEDCCICMDKITDPKWLPCKHVFCTDCIAGQFKFKPACPHCGAVYGIITGDQPNGTMKTAKYNYSLPGYGGYKIIAVTYSFPSGYQSEEHPNPGKYYAGIQRTGYLPDSEKGRLVANLLRIAFDRRLVFTIGRSVTTGHEGVITWNDIHHKTRMQGGQQRFGYPDETYLDRVLDELAAKGVTENSLNN